MASQSQSQTTQPDAATLGALSVILLSGLPAPQMVPMVEAVLAPFGITAAAVAAAIGTLWPHLDHDLATAAGQPVSAIGHTLRTQPAREAAYLFNAAKRIQTAITTEGQSVKQPIGNERRYVGQHLAAERGRRDAARQVDTTADKYGPTIGWYAVMDGKTTLDCRTQNGTNFNAAVPPLVEGKPSYPGTVHLHCRCKAGAPHRAAVREPARVLVGA